MIRLLLSKQTPDFRWLLEYFPKGLDSLHYTSTKRVYFCVKHIFGRGSKVRGKTQKKHEFHIRMPTGCNRPSSRRFTPTLRRSASFRCLQAIYRILTFLLLLFSVFPGFISAGCPSSIPQDVGSDRKTNKYGFEKAINSLSAESVWSGKG